MQVIVVAFKNRKLPLPETNEQLYEVYKDATTTTLEKIAHTNQMRLLIDSTYYSS
jgi:peptide/histidine transporter 3/4